MLQCASERIRYFTATLLRRELKAFHSNWLMVENSQRKQNNPLRVGLSEIKNLYSSTTGWLHGGIEMHLCHENSLSGCVVKDLIRRQETAVSLPFPLRERHSMGHGGEMMYRVIEQ